MRRRNHHADPSDHWLRPGEEPALAAHLVSPRALYSHHGIYVGDGLVIHYAGLAYGWRGGPVEIVSLEHFARGHGIRVRSGTPFYTRNEVVARARSRLGEHRYRVLTNNCEHFCTWALHGERRSTQVEWLQSLFSSIVGRPGISADADLPQAENS